MGADEIRWSWRWRCPECETVIQGTGTERDKVTAEFAIVAHRADERMLAKRAS